MYKETFQKLKNTRFTSKTPRFFRIVRNFGLVATAAGVALSNAPASVPEWLVLFAGYLTWIGGTAATIAQFARE